VCFETHNAGDHVSYFPDKESTASGIECPMRDDVSAIVGGGGQSEAALRLWFYADGGIGW